MLLAGMGRSSCKPLASGSLGKIRFWLSSIRLKIIRSSLIASSRYEAGRLASQPSSIQAVSSHFSCPCAGLQKEGGAQSLWGLMVGAARYVQHHASHAKKHANVRLICTPAEGPSDGLVKLVVSTPTYGGVSECAVAHLCF